MKLSQINEATSQAQLRAHLIDSLTNLVVTHAKEAKQRGDKFDQTDARHLIKGAMEQVVDGMIPEILRRATGGR